MSNLDFIDYLSITVGALVIILVLTGGILAIKEKIDNETLYQYECVTLDNETITCDNVKETESGIIGKRDDTSYLIKQYKKVKKGSEDE